MVMIKITNVFMVVIKITNIFMVVSKITKKMLFEISTNRKFYINTINDGIDHPYHS